VEDTETGKSQQKKAKTEGNTIKTTKKWEKQCF
jgi:hypothetical protein